MPMDRHDCALAAGRSVLIAGVILSMSAGCRSTHSEVPPGKPYQTTGGMPPTVGFSSEPHPSMNRGPAGLYGNKGPGGLIADGTGSPSSGGDVVLGTPTPGEKRYSAPTNNLFGPPGTSGLAGSSGSASPTLGDSLLKTIPSGSGIVKEDMRAAQASGTSTDANGP
jgi:hypothetical protein